MRPKSLDGCFKRHGGNPDDSGAKLNGRAVRDRAIDLFNLEIGDGHAARRPVASAMESADPTAAVRKPVDHDVTAGRQALGRSPVDVVLFGIRNMQGKVVVAVRLVEINRVSSFRCALVTLVFFWADWTAAKRDTIAFQRRSRAKKSKTSRCFLYQDTVRNGIAGQGIHVEVGDRGNAGYRQENKQQEKQEQLQSRGGSIGLRARGSRSFVVAALGRVTVGPPSQGSAFRESERQALLANGNPSSGNSLRSGK